ncbi:hypothetical protein MTO96_001933 [Rhipicephalus appendiculatus]
MEKPSQLRDCSVSNQSDERLLVSCRQPEQRRPGQKFVLEVHSSAPAQQSQVQEQQPPLTNLSSDRPVFWIPSLEPGAACRLVLYAVSAGGTRGTRGAAVASRRPIHGAAGLRRQETEWRHIKEHRIRSSGAAAHLSSALGRSVTLATASKQGGYRLGEAIPEAPTAFERARLMTYSSQKGAATSSRPRVSVALSSTAWHRDL